MGPAQLRGRRAGLGLLEHGDDLAVGKTRFLHGEPPRIRLRENSTSDCGYFSGGLPSSLGSVS